MKPIYEKLFNRYCDEILRENEYLDEYELEKQLAFLKLDKDSEGELMDILFDYHHQWSLDSFAVGLHLGLSLMPSQRLAKRRRGDRSR